MKNLGIECYKMHDIIYIVDSSFFIEEHKESIRLVYTTQSVIEEAKSLKARLRMEIFNVNIQNPSKKSIEEIKKKAKEIGEYGLSNTDIEVLALAYELNSKYKVILLSDDYSIQNIASHLGINIKSISKKKISKIIEWEKYCLVCGNKVPENSKNCIYCGSSDVSRRIKRKI